MAFFGLIGNYSKPGPGVSKEEEEKSTLAKYFIVYGRRYTKFMQLNLIFLLPLIAALALMVGLFILPVQHMAMTVPLVNNWQITVDLWLTHVMTIPLFLLAPFWGGLMVVSRRMASEEYCFIWSEYWKGVKDNFKQFLANGIITYVFFAVTSLSAMYYNALTAESWLYAVLLTIVLCLSLVFVFAQYYVNMLIVSVNQPLKHIYKNALLLAILGLWRNLLLTVLLAVLLVGSVFALLFNMLSGLILIVIMIFFLFSFMSYTLSFICYPVVKKYVHQPYLDSIAPKPEKEETEEEFLEKMRLQAEKEDEQPKYIYVNGRLIKNEEYVEKEDDIVFTDRT